MFKVVVGRRAEKELKSYPQETAGQILDAIKKLGENPFPPGVKKLKGRLKGVWRIRIGSYRALYDVYSEEGTILIVKIGPRKSVYR